MTNDVQNLSYVYLPWALFICIGFLGDSAVKNTPVNAQDMGLILGSGRSPGEGNGDPLQYSCLEHSHGQRSLLGYSPWGHKELDTTEAT